LERDAYVFLFSWAGKLNPMGREIYFCKREILGKKYRNEKN
jgi:hypothetical protein